MFITKELKNIDRTYFHIIHAGCYSITLQSKNTKHYWHILQQEYPLFTSCKIWHKHKQTAPFHEQGNVPTLKQAMDKIREHDHYHLYVRSAKKKTFRMSAQRTIQHSTYQKIITIFKEKESSYGRKKQKTNRIRCNKKHTFPKHTTDQVTGGLAKRKRIFNRGQYTGNL